MNRFSHDRLGEASNDTAATGIPKQAVLAVREPVARLYLLTRLIAALDEFDQQQLTHLLGCGFTPDLVQQLRGMTLADAVRVSAGPCGLAISIDPQALRTQIAQVERLRADRALCEYFIHHRASPGLMRALFRLGPNDVRRMRKLLAPDMAKGGRPRTPPDPMRSAVAQAWVRICRAEAGERQRYWLLHQEFMDQPITTLEAIVRVRPPVARQRGVAATSRPESARVAAAAA
jgi:hypothetical protein